MKAADYRHGTINIPLEISNKYNTTLQDMALLSQPYGCQLSQDATES